MKFVDDYRDPTRLKIQLAKLRRMITRRWVIMDVCGGQTHGLLRHGLEQALEDVLDLVHGPGCPVCVTPAEAIDDAVEIANRPDVVMTSFGDMLRVPGGQGSLLQARARGSDIRIVYSPADAVRLAVNEPEKHVVFLAVGFESTAPATALAVLQARRLRLTNFSLLANHVRVEPAMRAVMQLPGNRIEGMLAAGHVCTVTGFAHYSAFVEQFQVPIVVTGFEPVDLLAGLTTCVQLLESGTPQLCNEYCRSVRSEGNLHAKRLIDEVYNVATVQWRGFHEIADGGLVIRPSLRDFDARSRFGLAASVFSNDGECLSGDVMTGRTKPIDCPLFGHRCTPDTPFGAPMVSSEGACGAYYRYARPNEALS